MLRAHLTRAQSFLYVLCLLNFLYFPFRMGCNRFAKKKAGGDAAIAVHGEPRR
jgi:hypothetical protein